MITILKDSQTAAATSNFINPYAIDVIQTKRKDLVYGISHTEDILDLLVTEGVLTAMKRSIVLTIRGRKDQNSRVLDMLEARGERACRIFFHPCLMLAEPDLYQQIKTYLGNVNERIRDTRRQLIGYLLEREQEATMTITNYRMGAQRTRHSFVIKETKGSDIKKREEKSSFPLLKPDETKLVQTKSENDIHAIVSKGELNLLEELLNDIDVNSVNSSMETLLHVAAENGHLSIVEVLHQRGASLDLQDKNNQTALHRAARRGHSEVVKALLQAGAPMYTMDLQGKTPVHLAAENGHLDTVKVLLKEEADLCESCTRDMFLHMAAKEDDWKLTELLLQSGAAVDAQNDQNKTALFYAVAGGHDKTLTVLLNAGAKVDRDVMNEAIKLSQESVLKLLLDNTRGTLSEDVLNSALFSAVRHNHNAVLTALIDSGANINICDKQGYTPLLLSAELGHTEVFSVLTVKQAKLDAALPDLSSALHLAVQGGCVPIVEKLLEKGLDPNIIGSKAQTPLHLAAVFNRSDLVGLLSNAGSKVNAVNQDGATPLHLASQQGNDQTAVQLIKRKADLEAVDRQGWTALHYAAAARGKNHVVDVLLSTKANADTPDKAKKTALHLAAMEGNVDAVTSLLSHKVKAGAKDMDGSTPLHYAAAGGFASIVSLLLQSLKKKGLEERNAWRKTPLHVAAEKGHDNVAVLLLEAGAKINTTDHNKDTPLHCAAQGGHLEMVKRLVGWGQSSQMGKQKKVNLQATNKVGKTPLQIAETGDTPQHESIATLLKRKMFLIK